MTSNEGMLQVFKVSFIVFLTLTIVFLIATIVMFIKFDIRGIWAMKSGKAVEKAIKQKANDSAQSGKLRKKKAYVPQMQSEELGKTDLLQPVVPDVGLHVQTQSQQFSEGTNLTTNLKVEDKSVPLGNFMIEQRIVFIHTEEII